MPFRRLNPLALSFRRLYWIRPLNIITIGSLHILLRFQLLILCLLLLLLSLLRFFLHFQLLLSIFLLFFSLNLQCLFLFFFLFLLSQQLVAFLFHGKFMTHLKTNIFVDLLYFLWFDYDRLLVVIIIAHLSVRSTFNRALIRLVRVTTVRSSPRLFGLANQNVRLRILNASLCLRLHILILIRATFRCLHTSRRRITCCLLLPLRKPWIRILRHVLLLDVFLHLCLIHFNFEFGRLAFILGWVRKIPCADSGRTKIDSLILFFRATHNFRAALLLNFWLGLLGLAPIICMLLLVFQSILVLIWQRIPLLLTLLRCLL